MKAIIKGTAFVLGDDIDTDQIIPAQYLTYNPALSDERKMFGRFALCGLPDDQSGLPQGKIPFVDKTDASNTVSRFSIIVAGKNFGCGSSREHAPLALAEAGVKAVVAESYARIFFRNAVNGGYLVPFESAGRLIEQIATGDEIEIRTGQPALVHCASGKSFALKPLGEVGPIVEAGGIFAYAKRSGML